MEELKESEKILKKYLEKTHPEYLSEERLGSKDIEVLAEYCIERHQIVNDLLKAKGINSTHDKYFGKDNRTDAGIVREEIQYIYKRFDTKKNEANEDGMRVFDDKFETFLEWWISEMDDKGKRYCCYCGVDEDTVRDAFDNGLISSTKISFSGELQIERLKPDGGYNPDNCRFACVVCNNAKSDMFKTPEVFIKYFKPREGIRDFWYDTKEQAEKKMNK